MSTALIKLSDWQTSQIEIWLPTQYEGYDVSSFGRVRSWWARKSRGIGRGSYAYVSTAYKILKPSLGSRGYFRAGCSCRNRPELIHQLVADAFLPNLKNLRDVNHKNGIKTDNRLDNLERCDHATNMAHAFFNGLANNTGSRNGSAKLTEADVRTLKQRSNVPVGVVSSLFGVSEVTVRDIRRGRYWRHV